MERLKKVVLILSILTVTLFGSQKSQLDEKIKSAIVKVYTVAKIPDFTMPWNSKIRRVNGSGAVIDGKRILTNAHVVANRTYIEIQKYGDRKRYIARVEAVSHQLDLALLRVRNEDEFFRGIEPLKLGKLPNIEQKVAVYGFPMGGDTLSVTKGIVSRIEHQRYVHCGEHFLAIQIDAAVNPGNSGGPAISNGKIVGVVMEGISKAQSISYLVPTMLVRHFLEDISDGKLDGVPSLGFLYQKMENPTLRKYYKIDENHTGILVDKTIYSSGLQGIIKNGDVLVSVDDHTIQNDGTVAFRKNEFTNFDYFVELHQIGESVKLGVYIDSKITSIDVNLTTVADNLQLLKNYEYDKQPRFLIYGGYLFAPLSRNLAAKVASSYTELLSYARKFVTKSKKEVVLLQRVLPDEINRGDYDFAYWPIEKINGKKFRDFDTFIQILLSLEDNYIVLENKLGTKVIIDIKEAKRRQKEILRKYNIEYPASFDILRKYKILE